LIKAWNYTYECTLAAIILAAHVWSQPYQSSKLVDDREATFFDSHCRDESLPELTNDENGQLEYEVLVRSTFCDIRYIRTLPRHTFRETHEQKRTHNAVS